MLLDLDTLAQILILRSLCKVSYSRLNETPKEDISAYTAGEALGSWHQTSWFRGLALLFINCKSFSKLISRVCAWPCNSRRDDHHDIRWGRALQSKKLHPWYSARNKCLKIICWISVIIIEDHALIRVARFSFMKARPYAFLLFQIPLSFPALEVHPMDGSYPWSIKYTDIALMMMLEPKRKKRKDLPCSLLLPPSHSHL